MNIKISPVYLQEVEGKTIVSETSDIDENLHIVGIDTDNGVEFIRFSFVDGNWERNKESMDMETVDFRSKIKLPKLKAPTKRKRRR